MLMPPSRASSLQDRQGVASCRLSHRSVVLGDLTQGALGLQHPFATARPTAHLPLAPRALCVSHLGLRAGPRPCGPRCTDHPAL